MTRSLALRLGGFTLLAVLSACGQKGPLYLPGSAPGSASGTTSTPSIPRTSQAAEPAPTTPSSAPQK